jgi:hypothetical protein
MVNTTGDTVNAFVPECRSIDVTARNIWFLEKSIPLFGLLDFFPADSIGSPEFDRAQGVSSKARKLTIETDQEWSFTTDITSDSKVFRNKSRNRGTGKWVVGAQLQPGDRIIIEKLEDYRYLLKLERK